MGPIAFPLGSGPVAHRIRGMRWKRHLAGPGPESLRGMVASALDIWSPAPLRISQAAFWEDPGRHPEMSWGRGGAQLSPALQSRHPSSKAMSEIVIDLWTRDAN